MKRGQSRVHASVDFLVLDCVVVAVFVVCYFRAAVRTFCKWGRFVVDVASFVVVVAVLILYVLFFSFHLVICVVCNVIIIFVLHFLVI